MTAVDVTATTGYLARALKTPTTGRGWEHLAVTVRDEGWSHEEYLAAVLQRQGADREANGTSLRVASAHFPKVKTLEDFTTGPSALAAPGCPGAPVHHDLDRESGERDPARTARSREDASGHRTRDQGLPRRYPVAFNTATDWAVRLHAAHRDGRLEHELKPLRRYRLLIIDEVGYRPFDADTANRFFQLIASRYEQGSILFTSNMPFG